MNYIDLIGSFAGVLTTLAFLPQVIKVMKTKSTRDISIYMFIIFTVGVLSWLVYGIFKRDWPLILANLITLVLALTILGCKIKYK